MNQYESCNNQTADALDAYARAAELDPGNAHIKARLQLLKSGGGAGGNQHNAPAPQDVHPQAYQNGVGVPPNPGWGGSTGQSQHQQQPPLDAARVSEWTRGIPQLNQPNGPAHQQNGFEGRDGMRAPPIRAPSPRNDQLRPYGEPNRHTPGPVRKHSPSPKLHHAGPSGFPPAPQTLPQLNLQDRPPAFNGGMRPSPTMNGAPPPPQQGGPTNTLPPYGRPFSPPSEIRPLRDDHANSPPSNNMSHSQYPGSQPFPSIANGVTSAPQPLPQTAEAPREDTRPPSAMKRSRDWEAEGGPSKKIANEETRARLDEPPRHSSPLHRNPTPRDPFRRDSSEIRRENERRANENYHPSEAAHHPYSLAPQMPSVQAPAPPAPEPPKEERKEVAVEPAARKMDVDEDYDNDSEDGKKAGGSGTAPGTATRNSPIQGASTNGVAKQEATA